MKFFECECKSHALSVYHDKEYDEFDFALWHITMTNNGIFQRLRLCWHLLKSGNPYGDLVVMNSPQVKELINYLSERVKW